MIQRKENELLSLCVDEISRWGWNQTSAVLYRPSSWLYCNRTGFAFDVNNRYLRICTGTQNGANRLHDRL